jgi:hypothetical protein
MNDIISYFDAFEDGASRMCREILKKLQPIVTRAADKADSRLYDDLCELEDEIRMTIKELENTYE